MPKFSKSLKPQPSLQCFRYQIHTYFMWVATSNGQPHTTKCSLYLGQPPCYKILFGFQWDINGQCRFTTKKNRKSAIKVAFFKFLFCLVISIDFHRFPKIKLSNLFLLWYSERRARGWLLSWAPHFVVTHTSQACCRTYCAHFQINPKSSKNISLM